MAFQSNIKYLQHKDIDKTKWDNCLANSANGLVYGYSFYLDHMAKHWDALVLNDYEAVMPLTWNSKMGIYYLYQPAFTANLGIFGRELDAKTTTAFLQAIPKKFKLIEISLNDQNLEDSNFPHFIRLDNYLLSLNESYQQLKAGYRENHRRNIQKAIHAGCVVRKNIPVNEIIVLNKEQMKDIISLSGADYRRFQILFNFMKAKRNAITYAVYDSNKQLLASAVFLFSLKRAYYILVGNHPAGKNKGASHAVVDAFIKDHAGRDLVLDFEGSDIESVALFYRGFGAKKRSYPAIRWNRLPAYVKWMKKMKN